MHTKQSQRTDKKNIKLKGQRGVILACNRAAPGQQCLLMTLVAR